MGNFQLKSININILGSWNTKIFNPKWLITNLELDKQPDFDNKIGFGLDFEEREARFDFCGIALIPTNRNLILQIMKPEQIEHIKNKCDFAELILKKLLLLLPHTPIKGIGFNFSFEFYNDTLSSFAKEILIKKKVFNDFNLTRNDYQKTEKAYTLTAIGLINNVSPNTLGLIDFHFSYKSPNYLKEDNIFCNHYDIVMRLING